MPESIKILGVRFDKVTLKQATDLALQTSEQNYITTPNPEILLKALKDQKYQEIINKSFLNVADGIGILWAASFLQSNKKIHTWLWTLMKILLCPMDIKKVLPERVTGTDLMAEICQKSTKPIFLLGAEEGVARAAAKKFSNSNVVGTYSGSPHEEGITKTINQSGAEILFVAFGAPAQEKWIAENLRKMPKIKLAIGVGGAFNFHAGHIKRAPNWMRKIGLEWLFRLIRQPQRIKRIYNATIKFPIMVYRHRKD